jgi:ribosomal protein S8E
MFLQIVQWQDGNSGSTTTGISSATADLNTANTTNTLALRIVGVEDDPANADFTALGIGLIVRINNHFNAPTGSIVAGTVSTTGV